MNDCTDVNVECEFPDPTIPIVTVPVAPPVQELANTGAPTDVAFVLLVAVAVMVVGLMLGLSGGWRRP